MGMNDRSDCYFPDAKNSFDGSRRIYFRDLKVTFIRGVFDGIP